MDANKRCLGRQGDGILNSLELNDYFFLYLNSEAYCNYPFIRDGFHLKALTRKNSVHTHVLLFQFITILFIANNLVQQFCSNQF